MGDSDITYESNYDERDDGMDSVHYLGYGLWSHPETSRDFYSEDERKNK